MHCEIECEAGIVYSEWHIYDKLFLKVRVYKADS